MSAQQVSKLLLERYLAGDLDRHASTKLQKQLAENPQLQKQLELLSQEKAKFLAENPATTFAATVVQRATRQGAKSGWSFSDISRWVLAPTLVVALVAGVFVLMPLRQTRQADSIVAESARETAKVIPSPSASSPPAAAPQQPAYAKPPPELARLDHSSVVGGAGSGSAHRRDKDELVADDRAPVAERAEKKSAKRELGYAKAKAAAEPAPDDSASAAPLADLGSGLGAANGAAGGASASYARAAPASPAPPAPSPSFVVDLRAANGTPLGGEGSEGQLLNLRVHLPEPGMVVVIGVSADGARRHYAGSNTRRLSDAWFNARFRLASGQVGQERVYVVFARDELNLDQLLYGQPSDRVQREVFIVSHPASPPPPATNAQPEAESKPGK